MRITLLNTNWLAFGLTLILSSGVCCADTQEIALTIDDLPFVGESKNAHLNMIITTLKENNVPATGFIIAGNVREEHWQTLHKFRDAGLGLGNHTLTHINLNQVPAEVYLHEIEEADQILQPVLTQPKYFRYPYLATGRGEKAEIVKKYLNEKNYQIAPITIDSKDFIFNQRLLAIPQLFRRECFHDLELTYLDFIWQQTLKAKANNQAIHSSHKVQILLIHANLLNAYALPNLINLYKQKGFTFVSLEHALQPNCTLEEKLVPLTSVDIETYMAWD